MDKTADAAKRLWTLCNVLRDDGITYNEYISELTLLLFFKLASALGVEQDIPTEFRWSSLIAFTGNPSLERYIEALKVLSNSAVPALRTIFADSSTDIRHAASLERLLDGIDSIAWQRFGPDGIGEIYESLIGKNAQESRYGAGQYFTPRALVNAMVAVSKPAPTDSVYDPAAGTAGFLVAAGLHSRSNCYEPCELYGNELVRDVSRLGQMNLHLHKLNSQLRTVDTLSLDPGYSSHTLCLTNPPFGIRSDLNPRQQARLEFPTSNKQLCFIQHIYSSLAIGGRAAVVVPDNVLYESGIAAQIRSHLLDNFNLHTLLRLPAGIFYATGVKTSVLFFTRTEPTTNMWIYDLRSQKSKFTKKRPLSSDDLADFVMSYGRDPMGLAKRRPTQYYRKFSRKEINASGDRLDLLGQSNDHSRQSSPSALIEVIAMELEHATSAVIDLKAILEKAEAVD